MTSFHPQFYVPLLDGQTSTRHTAHDIALKPGDSWSYVACPT
jgi:hypothetical protein